MDGRELISERIEEITSDGAKASSVIVSAGQIIESDLSNHSRSL